MNFFIRRVSEGGMLIKQVSLCDPAGEEPHREVINQGMPPLLQKQLQDSDNLPQLYDTGYNYLALL